MFRSIISSLIVSTGLVFSGAAFAGSDYSSGQIVDFLVKSADMGQARGICIGTVDECSSGSSKPAGFDMLISFGLDSAELTEAAKINLEEIAKALQDQRLSAAKFIVEGHTDASGSDNYNLSLSERRARSVTDFLLDRGLASDKVTPVGVGESSPRSTDAFDPTNRRVEIRINLQ